MLTIKCPHCGAPPPPGYTPPQDRKFGYACMYCHQQSVHGSDPEPSHQQIPQIVIIQAPDHDHHDHHYVDHQVVASVNTARSVSWIIWVVVVLFVTAGGGGGFWMRLHRHASGLAEPTWDGKTPLICSGNDHIDVTGVHATFTAGAAISASSNCHVKCTECVITAPTAIEASSNAEVIIINGTIQGTSVLADATNNAKVTISGNVTASGKVNQKGNAKVSAPTPPTPSAAPTEPPKAAATPAPASTPAKPGAKAATPTTKPKTTPR